MTRRSQRTAGLEIAGTTVAVLALAGVYAAATSAGAEEATRSIIRQTARLSLLLFTAAFAASSLLRLWPNDATRWMLRNRRWLGLSFALSHFVHLGAILALLQIDPDFAIDGPTIVFGGAAYVFIFALAATSFDAAVARLGKQRWRRLHATGTYYIWLLFILSYGPRALSSPAYVPPALLLLAALGLRLAARRTPTAAVPSLARRERALQDQVGAANRR